MRYNPIHLIIYKQLYLVHFR